MKLKVSLLVFIYSTIFLLLGTSWYLKSIKISKNVLYPLGTSYSVLSAKDTRIRPSHVVYGFLPYWMIENTEYLQVDKLTDIAYFALHINPDGTIQKLTEEGTAEPGYNNWRNNDALPQLISKAKTQNVNFALTIISHDDETTYEFLDCRDCWDTLLSEITRELDFRGISNLNMDFELVEQDVKEGYNQKYSQLVNFLNNRLDAKYGESFVVTSTLPDSAYKPRITEISSLANASDALFVMAYDFHRPTSDTSGPIAPISGVGETQEYDLNTMLKDYLALTTADKLILGVPYYGYNWLVTDGSPQAERIPGDDILGFSISQTYATIADTKLKYNPEIKWDEIAQVPYFTYLNEEYGTVRQVYFEDEDSIRAKYKFAKNAGLAGVGIWALGYDGGYQELWGLIKEEFLPVN